MTVIRINAIEVPDGLGAELEARFARRAAAVDDAPGFLGFELLRPTGDAERRYFVVTRWESEAAFLDWTRSEAFQRGHAESREQPLGTHSTVLEFESVVSSTPERAAV
ncbi:MAG TPA: antibiotic biosynthesis monooxygenase [Acidimicrobiales bacterium]|nr:antibiotic biosynthesis monooxygenase [Acidimicrobiales bacterium]